MQSSCQVAAEVLRAAEVVKCILKTEVPVKPIVNAASDSLIARLTLAGLRSPRDIAMALLSLTENRSVLSQETIILLLHAVCVQLLGMKQIDKAMAEQCASCVLLLTIGVGLL